jgi:hypothetical protein
LLDAIFAAPVAQGREQLPSKQRVGGSNPSGRARPYVARLCDDSPIVETAKKANAHPLAEAAEAFLLTKRIAGCTAATLHIYGWWLQRLQAEGPWEALRSWSPTKNVRIPSGVTVGRILARVFRTGDVCG